MGFQFLVIGPFSGISIAVDVPHLKGFVNVYSTSVLADIGLR